MGERMVLGMHGWRTEAEAEAELEKLIEAEKAKGICGGVFAEVGLWCELKKRSPDMLEVAKIESMLRSNPTLAGLAPRQLVPVDPVRLDGKKRMEFLLKELKLEYVLNGPCPSIMPGPDASAEEIAESKAAEDKWKKDDFMCLRTILNYLGDNLLHRYSERRITTTAKQLWDDLKLMFGSGTKISQVRKYMEFQMSGVEPIVQQAEEFNCIFDALVASGMELSEDFHISAILAKLPASWKDVSIKLMRKKKSLTLQVVMDQLRVEEERIKFQG